MALVLKSAKREATSVGRCVAISSLAVYIYCQLAHGTKHAKVKEAIAVLLAVLKVMKIIGTFFVSDISSLTIRCLICTLLILFLNLACFLLRRLMLDSLCLSPCGFD